HLQPRPRDPAHHAGGHREAPRRVRAPGEREARVTAAAVAPRVVVIVGAGVTGLAAALALTRDGAGRECVVLEAGARAGGNLRTRREGDYLIDEGPDGFVR